MAHHPNNPQHHQHSKRKGLHKDWRSWTVVVLMLAAMALYILTLDESQGPEGEPRQAIENVEVE